MLRAVAVMIYLMIGWITSASADESIEMVGSCREFKATGRSWKCATNRVVHIITSDKKYLFSQTIVDSSSTPGYLMWMSTTPGLPEGDKNDPADYRLIYKIDQILLADQEGRVYSKIDVKGNCKYIGPVLKRGQNNYELYCLAIGPKDFNVTLDFAGDEVGAKVAGRGTAAEAPVDLPKPAVPEGNSGRGVAPRQADKAQGICSSNTTSCINSKSLFVCNYDNAVRVSKEGHEAGLFLVSKKECSVASKGIDIKIEKTQNDNVSYLTTDGSHLGYAANMVELPPEPFPDFPSELRGIWMSSGKACQQYAKDGPDESQGAYLYIDRKSIHGFETTEHLLLITKLSGNSWSILTHSASDGDDSSGRVTVSLRNGMLSFGSEPPLVLCRGAKTPQQIYNAEQQLKRFKPLQLTRDNLVTEGRCHMESCSWVRWLSAQVVGAEGGNLNMRLYLWGGNSGYGRNAKIKWDKSPYFVDVTCSYTRPVLSYGKLSTELELGPKHRTYGSVFSVTKIYFVACHSDMNADPDKAAAAHRYDMKE